VGKMTACPKSTPVGCEVDREAVRQIVLAHMTAHPWVATGLPELVRACCALRPCASDLTLCEVSQCQP